MTFCLLSHPGRKELCGLSWTNPLVQSPFYHMPCVPFSLVYAVTGNALHYHGFMRIRTLWALRYADQFYRRGSCTLEKWRGKGYRACKAWLAFPGVPGGDKCDLAKSLCKYARQGCRTIAPWYQWQSPYLWNTFSTMYLITLGFLLVNKPGIQ